MENLISRNAVLINKVQDWNEARKAIKNYDDNDEVRVIVLLWEDLIWFSSINKKNVKVILWVAHFFGLRVGETCRYRVAKWMIKNMAYSCIKRLLKLENIVCFDEMSVSYTIEYYKKLKKEQFKIIRLPIKKCNIKEEILKLRSESNEMNILTISRADFPFKGYLIGLIEFVKVLVEDGEDVKLTIISYGEGIDVLKEKIAECDVNVRNRISLLGKTDYGELERYYQNVKLYIGMDTTIIDAAQRGIISIPVVADTYELSADSFYHEDGLEVRKTLDTKNNIKKLYDKVKNLSPKEYYKLAQKSREIVIENFSVEKNVGEFLSLFEKVKGNKFAVDIWGFYLLYYSILKLRKEK